MDHSRSRARAGSLRRWSRGRLRLRPDGVLARGRVVGGSSFSVYRVMRGSYPAVALWAVAVCAGACAPAARPEARRTGGVAVREATGLRDAFDRRETVGVFALQRVGTPDVTVSDAGRARRPYLPASTFKVPNSLIALELGVVEDAETRFPMTWPETPIEAWNRDHTFASALRHSVVPVYQIIARQVGEARYRDWLARLEYGNADPGGGVDHFWLDGSLRTSALDQIDFLARLTSGALPVSERSRGIVRRMLLQEEGDGYTLFAKTGLVGVAADRELEPEERVGWYVGWVETDTATWAFALNLDVRGSSDAAARVPIAKELLRRSGALPAGSEER